VNGDGAVGVVIDILDLCETIDELLRKLAALSSSERLNAWIVSRSGSFSTYHRHLQVAAAEGDLNAFESFVRSLISQAVPLSEPPEGNPAATEWILALLDRLAHKFEEFTSIRDGLDADPTLSQWSITAANRQSATAAGTVSTKLVRAAQDRSRDLTTSVNEQRESKRTLGDVRLHLAISKDANHVSVTAWQSSLEREDLIVPVLIRLEGRELEYYIILGKSDKFRSTLRFVSTSPTNLASWNGSPIPWSLAPLLEPPIVTRSVAHTSGRARQNWRSAAIGNAILEDAVRSGETGEEKLV
jgi:hypothetical protein